jgi:uncharacterized membrane protein YdjX (TVP38/TMEM64 family)
MLQAEDAVMTGATNRSFASQIVSAVRSRPLLRLAIALVVVTGLVAGLFIIPVKSSLRTVLEWTDNVGLWGPVIVASLYTITCVFLLPSSVLTVSSGFLFGVFFGTAVAMVGSTIGACAAYAVGHTLAHDWVQQRVERSRKLQALNRALTKDDFRIVLLTRLSPLTPFPILNYVYGVTNVSFWRYVTGTFLGMLPGTFLFVYAGSGLRTITQAAAGETSGPEKQVFFWAGLAVTIFAVAYATFVVKRSLAEETGIDADGPAPSEAPC